ncbi:MAG: LamG-like jellyroll fold domain-containing protein [Candidatus Saccharimonadales bacterium]
MGFLKSAPWNSRKAMRARKNIIKTAALGYLIAFLLLRMLSRLVSRVLKLCLFFAVYFAAFTYTRARKPLARLRYLALTRPHNAIARKYPRYNAYHQLPMRRLIHAAILGVYLLSIGGFLFVNLARTFAGDTTTSWDFSNASHYAYDNGIEIVGGQARLKAQNYTADANTAGLYHLDEAGGAVATDSSGNQNDAAVNGGTFAGGNLNNAFDFNGNNEYLSVPDSASLSMGQANTIEGWTKLDDAFSASSSPQRHGVVDKGDYSLYYDNETGKLTYELANSAATQWTRAAGNDVNGSWDLDGKRAATAAVMMGSNYYTGLGIDNNDAEVWRWDGTAWAMIGGRGINSSWPAQTYEYVYTLETDGTNVYAALGSTAGDAEVWRWDGTDWDKIGGDTLNSSWAASTYELVSNLEYTGGSLYAGLGSSTLDAEVWRWNGTAWTKIGGDGLSGSWNTNYEIVYSLMGDGTNLYAGIGNSTTDAEVWRWNGTTWAMIGGDGVNSSWNTNYESIHALAWQGSTLYAGLGETADDAEVWSYNGSAWTKIGGDGLSGSWAASTYEIVYTLAHDGTNLYAGLGNGDGDGEVYRWNGSAWTKIGGDGVNSSWATATGDIVYELTADGSNLYAALYDASGSSYVYRWNGSTWTVIGGQYINDSWGYYAMGSVETLFSARGKLYAGIGSATGSAQVWELDGATNTWDLVGGQAIRGSWAANSFELITSMQSYGGNLVVGLGNTATDAEVWSYNGSTWTKIGGDGQSGSWNTSYEEVNAMANYGGYLYAGIGNSAGDAEVYRWDGTAWTKIGGDGLNGSWNTNYERVSSMAIYNGQLIAGLGNSAGDSEVYRWNGTAWTKIGGDGVNSSWNSTPGQVESMLVYNNKLYAGLGIAAGDADLWEWNGTAWAQAGGDDVNGSWISGTFENVRSMTVYSGELIVGLGNSAGDGEVWKYSGSTWAKIGGGGLNNGWGNTIEEVESMSNYQGRLYIGTGNSANADANVWSWGNNGFLQSAATSFDTAWRHVAASYDGITMKLFINGTQDAAKNISLSLPDSARPLLIGTGYGGREQGKPQAYFKGLLDEIRISNNARTSFTSLPYATTPQVMSLANAAFTSGVRNFDVFDTTETADGGAITYRLSDDNGATWKYWDGSAWATSANTAQANTETQVHQNIVNFPVTFYGIRWQAILSGNGNQRVTLNQLQVQANSDMAAPSANASAIQAYKSNGGGSLASNAWTNGSSPYFTWTAGADSGAGIKGYCLYLGTDNTADPVTTAGLLGTSPTHAGSFCQFLVTANSVDFATAGYINTALTSSSSPYYLRIKAIDNAGNVFGSAEQFQFRFDNTAPANPGFITAPSGFINTKETTLTWPTTGGSAASDANSGLAGLQYRINGSSWYGDAHNGTGDMTDLLTNDGSYLTIPTPDFTNINEGINTIHFRTWDLAGNVTNSYVTATLKVNTAGAPSEPQNLAATPSTNTANSFAFDWDAPATFVGDANNITYCYSINTLPTGTNCIYTSPGVTSLGTGPYATQPGTNTLYVVARDESNNINYASFASVNFSANTPSPGIPQNLDIVDVSIKATSKWRLAITWEEPTYTGSGIASYRVYRSTDNTNFSFVGSSSSTTYIDANLSQQTYYYYVRACDNTNNCGANSTTVNLLPTGRFTSPAALTSNPETDSITTKKATITWTTDRTSDSKIAIGTSSGQYGSSEIGNSDQVTSHAIELDNLAAGTTYYYVARWTDEDGNTGTSQEFTFTTAPAPTVREIETSRIGLSGATVQFKTKGAAKVTIYYGQSDSFGGLKSINTSSEESQYTFDLDNLADGSKYFYKLSAFDSEGTEYAGNVFSFTTPPRPRISNMRFQPVAGEPTSTQLVSWQTNVPSTSMVIYGKVGGQAREIQSSELKSSHEVRISGLEDDSTYFIIAQGRDKDNNLAVSDRQQFKTALDTRSPVVTEISIESSIRGTGAEARGQVVISWKTDEPSMSQVGYADGSNATVFNSRTAEDTELTTEHLVIVSDLPPSKVYSLQPMSKDRAGNIGLGEPQSAIIGRASESVLTIILNTLQRVFGL